MEHISGEGWALIITAAGTAVVLIIREWKSVKTVARVEAKVEAATDKILEIDKAVNGKAPGEQSIAGQVDDLHKEIPIPELPEVVNGQGIKPLVELLVAHMLEQKAAAQKAGD